jgi:hypothetical protein
MRRAVASGSDWFSLVGFDDLPVVHVGTERLFGRIDISR